MPLSLWIIELHNWGTHSTQLFDGTVIDPRGPSTTVEGSACVCLLYMIPEI